MTKPATNDHVICGKTETSKQMLHSAKSISFHHCLLTDLLNIDLKQQQIFIKSFVVHIKKKILHVKLPEALQQQVREKKNELYDLKIQFVRIKCPSVAEN